MKPTIIGYLTDAGLLGALPCFADLSSWRNWLVFLKAAYGLDLDESETATFRMHTGRVLYNPPKGGWSEVVCITGRQSGKTRIGGAVVAYESATAEAEADGTEKYALIVAQDLRGAVNNALGYVAAPFDVVPGLSAMVEGRTADEIRLRNHVTVAVYPCSEAAVRGPRAVVAVGDEEAFWRSTDNRPRDREVMRALRPTVAMTGGKIWIFSSPYGPMGDLHDQYRKHYGRESKTLVWQATAPEMNPLLGTDYLEKMLEDDPEAYQSEVLGQFRAGLSMYVDADTLDALVEAGVVERQPSSKFRHIGYVDTAGGSGRDSYAWSVAHMEGEVCVIDKVGWFDRPFDAVDVSDRVAREMVGTWRVTHVWGDSFAGDTLIKRFRDAGLVYTVRDRSASYLYGQNRKFYQPQYMRLLDVPRVITEFLGLERRTRRSAHDGDIIDHRRDAHDDTCNVVNGAAHYARNAALAAEGDFNKKTERQQAEEKPIGWQYNGRSHPHELCSLYPEQCRKEHAGASDEVDAMEEEAATLRAECVRLGLKPESIARQENERDTENLILYFEGWLANRDTVDARMRRGGLR